MLSIKETRLTIKEEQQEKWRNYPETLKREDWEKTKTVVMQMRSELSDSCDWIDYSSNKDQWEFVNRLFRARKSVVTFYQAQIRFGTNFYKNDNPLNQFLNWSLDKLVKLEVEAKRKNWEIPVMVTNESDNSAEIISKENLAKIKQIVELELDKPDWEKSDNILKYSEISNHKWNLEGEYRTYLEIEKEIIKINNNISVLDDDDKEFYQGEFNSLKRVFNQRLQALAKLGLQLTISRVPHQQEQLKLQIEFPLKNTK